MFDYLQRKVHRLTSHWKKKAVVLCYHRIAGYDIDPWNSFVTPENFDEQLHILSRHFNVVSLSDLVTDFDKVATRKTVCLSFDDGYLDNFSVARPLLKKHNLPASFFIASSFIGGDRLFWWDELTDIILRSPALPMKLSLTINQQQFLFDLGEDAILTPEVSQKIVEWKYYRQPPSKRCALYLDLWKILRTLVPTEQQRVMNDLRNWCGCFKASDYVEKLPMSESQLQALGEDPLFTVGLHTHNHVAMELHPAMLQEQEIVENQLRLQRILNKDIDIIAFPHGSYNEDSISLVKRHGLRAGFTSKKRLMTVGGDRYTLGRFSVRDWDGPTLKSKLDKWLSKTEL